jgi:hypothetical protein
LDERESIERLADLLLDKETIFSEDVEKILGKSAQQIEKEKQEPTNKEEKTLEREAEVVESEEASITYIVEPTTERGEKEKTE